MFFQSFQMALRFLMQFQTTQSRVGFLAWITSVFLFYTMNSRYMFFEYIFCGIRFVALWTIKSSNFMNISKVSLKREGIFISFVTLRAFKVFGIRLIMDTRVKGPFGAQYARPLRGRIVTCFVLSPGALHLAFSHLPYIAVTLQ